MRGIVKHCPTYFGAVMFIEWKGTRKGTHWEDMRSIQRRRDKRGGKHIQGTVWVVVWCYHCG